MSLRRYAKTLLMVSLLILAAMCISAFWRQPPREAEGKVLSRSDLAPQMPDFLLDMSDQDGQMLRRIEDRLLLNPNDLESRLLKGLLFFKAGYLEKALMEMDQIIQAAPNFHLAHLIRGDLLLIKVARVQDIGDNDMLTCFEENEEQLSQLRREVRVRLEGYLSLVDTHHFPQAVIRLSPFIKSVLLVDKSQNRLYVYENAGKNIPPRLVYDCYIVLGKKNGNKVHMGDLRTPEGVYFITYHIPGDRLPPKYGDGAFPLNYPNELDRKLQKTGEGIWLHGTDEEFYSRPPLDSEGCIVLTNDDLDFLSRYLQPGNTPVIIGQELSWLTPEQWLAQSRALQKSVDSWCLDWESGDVERYLNHYARDFWTKEYDLERWKQRKRVIARGKEYQKVSISDLSMYAYPVSNDGGKPMVVANFNQKYHSNNFNGSARKRLYLVQEDQQWRVLYEGKQ